ncbi:MAG: sensor histidine kinase, partial [Gemmatimonadota bacterium]|nr:sensor histidine kinase [Gemmatimonadota bacterium]
MTRVEAAKAGLHGTATTTVEERYALLEAQYQDAMRVIEELRAQDALKTQFLANISHDLRTPLTAVITHAEILRDGILGS